MTRPALLRTLVAVLTLAVLVPLALVAGGTPVRAAGLERETGYSCQYTGIESSVVPDTLGLPGVGGLPVPVVPSLGGSDDVDVAVTLDAPATVAPGGTLRLKGTATFTFGANATTTNASTVFAFLSDDFGVNVTTGGQKRLVRIARLTTSTSAPASPVVEARFTLPDLLVPTTATGRVSLSLPDEALVTNPVGTSPESVAFTGVLRTDSVLQPNRAVACALREGQKTSLGAVTLTAADDEAPAPATGGGDDGSVPPPATTGGTTSSGTGLPAVAPPPSTAPATSAPVATAPDDLVQAALASDPIPPQTVPDGLRVPPWTMLLVGAALAGGLFAAVGSHRRLRRLTAGAAALGLLLVVPTPLTPQSPAEAASGQAQVTLICVYQADGSPEDARARDQPTGVSITLDVPDAVAPGDVVTLTGTATVQAPEDIRSQAAALGYNKLDAISDVFSVGMTVGSGPRQVLLADRWQTGKTAFSNPLVVRGPLSFPAFKVPDDASGSIKLELPRNEVADRRPKPYRNANTPPRVAMEFLASATGNGTTANYIVSCWRNDDGAGTIATIPVARPGSTQATTPPGSGATAPTAGGQTQQPTTGSGDPGQTLAPPAGDSTPGAAPSAGQATTAPATPGATTTAAPLLQGATATAAPTAAPATSSDVTVPVWVALVTVLLALAAYGFAGWNHLRLRSSRRGVDG